jgi:hypothetical protein
MASFILFWFFGSRARLSVVLCHNVKSAEYYARWCFAPHSAALQLCFIRISTAKKRRPSVKRQPAHGTQLAVRIRYFCRGRSGNTYVFRYIVKASAQLQWDIDNAAFRLDGRNGLTGREQDICAQGCALALRAKAGPSEQTLICQSRGVFVRFRIFLLSILFTSCCPSSTAAVLPPATYLPPAGWRWRATCMRDVRAAKSLLQREEREGNRELLGVIPCTIAQP